MCWGGGGTVKGGGALCIRELCNFKKSDQESLESDSVWSSVGALTGACNAVCGFEPQFCSPFSSCRVAELRCTGGKCGQTTVNRSEDSL